MVDHRLTETQEMLRRSSRELLARKYSLESRREIPNLTELEASLWTEVAGLGWPAAAFSEELAGFPGSMLEIAPLLEEFGYAVLPTPLLHSTIAVGLAFAQGHAGFARDIATGKMVCVPAPVSSRRVPSSSETWGATLEAVPMAHLATHFLLPYDEGGPSLVAASDPAVTITPTPTSGLETRHSVRIEAAASRERLLNVEPDELRSAGATGTAVILVGVCDRALQLAVRYAGERVQFGRKIGSFQAIQHICAEMHIKTEIGKALAYKAAATHGDPEFSRSSSFAKCFIGDAARFVTRQAIQVHGGVGIIDQHVVQLPYRLGLDLVGHYGVSASHRDLIAQEWQVA